MKHSLLKASQHLYLQKMAFKMLRFRLEETEFHLCSTSGIHSSIDKGLMEMVCASSINVLILAIILAVTITMKVKIR